MDGTNFVENSAALVAAESTALTQIRGMIRNQFWASRSPLSLGWERIRSLRIY